MGNRRTLRRRARICVLLAIVFPAFCFAAQSPGDPASVVLTVLDESGAIIPNALIAISPRPQNLAEELKLGLDGKLSLLLPPGRYDIGVSAVGFASKRTQVELRLGDHVAIDSVLRAGSCPPGSCLTVTDEVQAQLSEEISREEVQLYPNNVDGLRQLLTNMVQAAKNGDLGKLNGLIKQTEIPHFDDWFTATFGREKGESWAGPYGQRLEENESRFQSQIVRLAHGSGQIGVRKVDATKMFDTLATPVDLFLAVWTPSGSLTNRPETIGYFFFIDWRFRWDSTIAFVSLRDIPPASAGPPERNNTEFRQKRNQ